MPLAKCQTVAEMDAAQLDDNAVWASPVSNLAGRMCGASVHTPRARGHSEQALLSDSVRFGVDDSNDSLHQFLQRGEAGDDSEIELELSQQADTPCRALTFCSSPSEPAVGSAPPLAELAGLQRLASAPATSPSARASAPSALRRSGKRASPAAAASGRPATPKRARMQPLADLSNRQAALATELGGRPAKPALQRCASECVGRRQLDSAKIDSAIASIDSLNLVGDSQQGHSLPTVERLNFGIRHVTCATVSRLLRGDFKDKVASYQIIDCRYPYEYDGGHIKGAVNIFTQAELLARVVEPLSAGAPRPVLIFHCEFSSERAPRLARFLRQHDRELNSLNYPQLYFPEVYVLQGGYKCFFESHKEDCLPHYYTKMADPDFKAELAKFQKQSRAWERQNSRSKHSKLERLAQQRLL